MTPTRRQTAEFQFRSWRVPEVARAIECPLEVLEDIRAFCCGELSQPSQSRHEVGGVLFGIRRDDAIRIQTWRAIACEHTEGEGLQLSSNDRMNLAVLLERARQTPGLKDLRPVGWFVSHLQDDVSLSTSDLEVYDGFFPDAWQITLVICPVGSRRARAAYVGRKVDRNGPLEISRLDFHLEPISSKSSGPATSALMEAAPRQTVTKPVTPTPLVPTPTPANIAAPNFTPRTAAPPMPETLPAPSFHVDEKLPARERWLWVLLILVALAIGAFLLYQRRAPASNASLEFRASNDDQLVQLAWDANARSVRDSERGEIAVNDGADSSKLSLSSEQLHTGKLSYKPRSPEVGFVMTVYPPNSEPVHETARLTLPQLTAPPQLAKRPPPESQPAEHDVLQQQVQRLREELARERARASELQNLVRILEARQGIKPEPPQSNSKP